MDKKKEKKNPKRFDCLRIFFSLKVLVTEIVFQCLHQHPNFDPLVICKKKKKNGTILSHTSLFLKRRALSKVQQGTVNLRRDLNASFIFFFFLTTRLNCLFERGGGEKNPNLIVQHTGDNGGVTAWELN